MKLQLDNQTALVTGGTSGIGLAVAQRFVKEGARVFITGRDPDKLAAAVDALGDSASGVVADISDLSDIDRVIATIRESRGTLDALVANAGGGEFVTLEQMTGEHFDRTFGTNVRGTAFTVQKAVPILRDGGAIVLTGSTAAAGGTLAFGAYAASKAAIRSFGRTWAAELLPRRIRVNTVIPGSTNTAGLAELAADPASAELLLEGLASGVPMRRLGHPDEIAAAVLFLASNQSSFMTGSELVVDGGQTQI